MGKRYYNLYPQVIQPLNLWHAYKQAARVPSLNFCGGCDN
jgi:hypothetical protein